MRAGRRTSTVFGEGSVLAPGPRPTSRTIPYMDTASLPSLDEIERRYPARDLPLGAAVTRVAPSPTGRPHVGTALQAIIDYALAHHGGGAFILRIEDTDRARLVEGAIDDIIATLDWLGLHPDEGPHIGGRYGPYIESERIDLYSTVAEQLVRQGDAYRCFCTPERLQDVRDRQQAAGQPTRYDRHCRNLSSEERDRLTAGGTASVVRLAMPVEGIIAFDDAVRGRIEFDAADQDDPVILKSDGFPTYHLAAMVDDHYMRVTTVVRGEEWVSSTPKHVTLMKALGWERPVIVHTPLLRDESGRKLGKRSGDTSIAWYRAQGYLPEAVRNFLIRIVWTHPDGKDVYPFEDFIRGVVPEALPKTGPVVNLSLLDFICGEYIRVLSGDDLYRLTAGWLAWLLANTDGEVVFEVAEKQGRSKHPVGREALAAFREAFETDPAYSTRILRLEPERYKKLGDVVLQNGFYYPQLFSGTPLDLLVKPTKGDVEQAACILREALAAYDPSASEEAWDAGMRAVAQRQEVKAGVPFMLLRVAVTGTDRSPPLFPIMSLLGPEEVRRRIESAIAAL